MKWQKERITKVVPKFILLVVWNGFKLTKYFINDIKISKKVLLLKHQIATKMKNEIEKLMSTFAQLGMTEHLTESERDMVKTLVTQTVKNAIWETKKAAEETMNELYKSC